MDKEYGYKFIDTIWININEDIPDDQHKEVFKIIEDAGIIKVAGAVANLITATLNDPNQEAEAQGKEQAVATK